MELKDFFNENPKVAIAFSGGVDSAYLLYEAIKCGVDVTAFYVKTQFQPEFEYQDALRLARELNATMHVINADALMCQEVVNNPENRCYYCKRNIFSKIIEVASEKGYSLILDGTNASDDASDRPGMVALKEMSVRSPLRECDLTKNMIRQLSKEAGLFTWDKPSYACLATRIRTGETITNEKLMIIEQSEAYLMKMGFKDFRIRMQGVKGKIQIRKEQFPLYFENEDIINTELRKYYDDIILDPEGRTIID